MEHEENMNIFLCMKRVKKPGSQQEENRKSILKVIVKTQSLDKELNLFGKKNLKQTKNAAGE